MYVKLERWERFQDARKQHNRNGPETLEKVEQATGVSTSTIQALESSESKRSPGIDIVARLAEHYGVSISWLLCQTEDHRIMAPAVDELGISEKAVNSLLTFKALKDSPVDPLVPGFHEELNKILESVLDLKDICTCMAKANAIRADLLDNNEDAQQRRIMWENGIKDQIQGLGKEFKVIVHTPEESITEYERNAVDAFRRIVERKKEVSAWPIRD